MIRPLDLQTLYMNLEKVGKEQAHSKEALAQAQADQVQKLKKEHDQGKNAVTKTTPSSGVEEDHSVKVQSDGPGADQGQRRQPRQKPAPEAEEENLDTAWKDPELGKHVDLSG